jgi:uncharacterized protein YdaU (DUF1376 family)
MATGKQPYIPIYIGDILKDWGHLPLDLFGAAHKLLYRMWDSKQRGKICFDFASYGTMLGVSETEAKRLIGKLTSGDEPIFNKEQDGDCIRLINRRMVREAALSATRSESGSKRGIKNRKQKPEEQENFASDLLQNNESKIEAKAKQIPEYDIENENNNESKNENDFEKSEKLLNDTGEKSKKPAVQKQELTLPFDSENFVRHWDWWRQYKQEQFSFRYKSVVTEQTALNELVKLARGDEVLATEIIKQSIANGWKGFFPIKPEANGPPMQQGKKGVFQANMEANIGAKKLLREMYENGAFDHYKQG